MPAGASALRRGSRGWPQGSRIGCALTLAWLALTSARHTAFQSPTSDWQAGINVIDRSALFHTSLHAQAKVRHLQQTNSNSRRGSAYRENITDQRSFVPDTTEFPFSAIGLVRLNARLVEANQSWCTGALIGPAAVLTAAHCLLRPDTGRNITDIEFLPGFAPFAPQPMPFPTSRAVATWVPPEFVDCATQDRNSPAGYGPCHQRWDYGVVLLNSTYEQWFDYGFNTSDSNTSIVNTAGYPGDFRTCALSANQTGCSMYHSSCYEANILNSSRLVGIGCFVYAGQSGSPLWTYNPDTDERLLRGVLTGNFDPTAATVGLALLIDSPVFNSIQNVVTGTRGAALPVIPSVAGR